MTDCSLEQRAKINLASLSSLCQMSATEMSRVTNTSAKPPRMTQFDGFTRKIGLDLGPQRGGLKEERD